MEERSKGFSFLFLRHKRIWRIFLEIVFVKISALKPCFCMKNGDINDRALVFRSKLSAYEESF